LIDTLRLAISSRIGDQDDFRRLSLKSDKSLKEVSFYRNSDYGMICQNGNTNIHISEDYLFDSIQTFIEQGYRSIICECWSGNISIQVPEDKSGKFRITYSQPENHIDLDQQKHLIDPEEASDLLMAIDVLNADGYMTADMRRKYVQVDNFVKMVYPLLSKSSQQGKIFILDCGTGKSYLSFVMNYFIREKLRRACHFYCIDNNSDLMGKCLRIKENLGYENMEFHVSHIKDFDPAGKVDIVCSLHACDTASDEAIAKAIHLKAPFLLAVPCCQHQLLNELREHPLKSITRHGVYKARLADLLTDAMRTLILEAAGYKVSVAEYVSPIYTPKNIMIQAERIQEINSMAMEQYLELKKMFKISVELERMLPELFPPS
jgi:hypothetical protein